MHSAAATACTGAASTDPAGAVAVCAAPHRFRCRRQQWRGALLRRWQASAGPSANGVILWQVDNGGQVCIVSRDGVRRFLRQRQQLLLLMLLVMGEMSLHGVPRPLRLDGV